MSTLDQTLWIAHPDAYDYLHTLIFDRGRGFVIQGDGQALKWASFFDYSVEGTQLRITYLPTEGVVGSDACASKTIIFERMTGEFHVPHPMGGESYKFGEVLEISLPIVEHESDSLRYYLCSSNVNLSEIAAGFKLKKGR